jgi:hypothetical protein
MQSMPWSFTEFWYENLIFLRVTRTEGTMCTPWFIIFFILFFLVFGFTKLGLSNRRFQGRIHTLFR